MVKVVNILVWSFNFSLFPCSNVPFEGERRSRHNRIQGRRGEDAQVDAMDRRASASFYAMAWFNSLEYSKSTSLSCFHPKRLKYPHLLTDGG